MEDKPEPKPVKPPRAQKKVEDLLDLVDAKSVGRGTKTRPRNTPKRSVSFFMPAIPDQIEFTK
jgi:hypothetical protein